MTTTPSLCHASIVTRKKAQLGIDILVNMAPLKIRNILNILSSILLILTYLIAFYLSVLFVLGAMKTGQLTPILRIKFYYIYMAMPIGFLLSTYRAIQVSWHSYIKKDDINDSDGEVYL